jgi:tRNA nucleotidyltransferase (CCA-adding enzyme)
MLDSAADGAELTLPELPDSVAQVIGRLEEEGREAAVVGGALRDLLLAGEATDWDVATAAPPETVAALFPGAVWENRFGTVTVQGRPPVQVTTYRSERGYSDRRRPDEVSWGSSLEEDLARRDFTINVLAWRPIDLDDHRGRLVDPHSGLADLRSRTLRAVGNPERRLEEDALRLLRAVRLATRFELGIEPATEAALRRHAPNVATVSGERVRDELMRILAADRPSRAFELMEDLGLLEVVLPELAALRGVPQAKAVPGDALDHSLRTADALPADVGLLRLAGLLHDVGKAVTLADGHFHRHEQVGATMVDRVGRRLRLSNRQIAHLAHLVRHHMFGYSSAWTDAAVRRFVRRVGVEALEDLFSLRRADDEASGATEPSDGGLAELQQRVTDLGRSPLEVGDLAVDGHELQRALGLPPGPLIGELLGHLLERVLDDPRLNEPHALLHLARTVLEERGAVTHHTGPARRADRPPKSGHRA